GGARPRQEPDVRGQRQLARRPGWRRARRAAPAAPAARVAGGGGGAGLVAAGAHQPGRLQPRHDVHPGPAAAPAALLARGGAHGGTFPVKVVPSEDSKSVGIMAALATHSVPPRSAPRVTDADLIRRCVAGEAAAARALHAQYYPVAAAFLRKLGA